MVGLLIVSHSRKIADGVRDLARQMTQGEVPIAAAGGTEDGSLGTSADLILEGARALSESSPEGILVLVDLGSAVMSAEIAMEQYDGPYLLSNAPLVEGAVMAAVESWTGADLERTAEAAEGAAQVRKIEGG